MNTEKFGLLGSAAEEIGELIDRHPRLSDEGAESPLGQLGVVGHDQGQSGVSDGFLQHDMAASYGAAC